MRMDRGFRVPEPVDRSISWPVRVNSKRRFVAIYDAESKSWLVNGFANAFGNPLLLIQQFGNDWHVVTIEQATEARP